MEIIIWYELASSLASMLTLASYSFKRTTANILCANKRKGEQTESVTPNHIVKTNFEPLVLHHAKIEPRVVKNPKFLGFLFEQNAFLIVWIFRFQSMASNFYENTQTFYADASIEPGHLQLLLWFTDLTLSWLGLLRAGRVSLLLRILFTRSDGLFLKDILFFL